MSRLASIADYRREIHETEALIEAEERIAEDTGGDFASEVTLDSLRARLRELEEQLAELRDEDLPGHELEITMSGTPVVQNRVRAEFLANILEETQKLVHALVNKQFGREARQGPWPDDVLRRSTLQVSETFAGSFGVKLEALDEQLEMEGYLAIQPAFDDLFRAIGTEKDGAEFLEELAPLGPRARSHLRELLSHVGKAEATLNFRWPVVRGEKTAIVTANRAEELADLLGRIEEEEWLDEREGRLGGAILRTRFFELELGENERISGRVSPDILQEVEEYFGRRVRAQLLVTRVTDRGTATERDTYRLMGLEAIPEEGDDSPPS